MNKAEISEYFKSLGKKGGEATKKKHGTLHYSKIAGRKKPGTN